jgi:hypothetical protein
MIDGVSGIEWVTDEDYRPVRRACLLNLMSSLRTRPTSRTPLLPHLYDVFFVANDRIYAKVDRLLLEVLRDLADDPDRPFYAEGSPNAPIHGQLLARIPEPPSVRSRFTELTSFRAEGRPSMQVVVAVPPSDLSYTYAEMDLDLANPLQDLVGFFVHMGELVDGKATNHLDMRKVLAKSSAREFLYYTVV